MTEPRAEGALLDVDGVVKRFGGIRAVDGASLEVAEGSITALIGPNGAGKTTLFNVLTGFHRGDGGSVRFARRGGPRPPAHAIARRGMVRTFQITKALAAMPVLDNMMLAAPDQPGERFRNLFLRPRAVRAREREVREEALELLEVFNLAEHADAYAGTLSGGQRKLLELARALMARPRLLMLDEPMAGINPSLGRRLLDHMQALRREPRHDLPLRRARHGGGHEPLRLGGGDGRGAGDRDRRPPAGARGPGRDRRLPGGRRMSGAEDDGAVLGRRGPGRRLRARGRHPQRRLAQRPRGGDRDPGRPQRRRQVDADQDDLRPAAGRAAGGSLLRGEDISGLEPHTITRRGMSYVPQLDNVFPSLSVEENLEMGSLDRSRTRERIGDMYEVFPRLGERRTQAAGTMSGGERQMLAMARALMPKPHVLLLDEPSAGLAPAFVEATFEKVREINEAGVTVVMVEQNARRALAMSDRGYVLDLGQNRFQGAGPRAARGPQGGRALPRRHRAASTPPSRRPRSRRGRSRASCESASDRRRPIRRRSPRRCRP